MKFRSRVEKGVQGSNGDSDWADEGNAISQDDFRTMFSNSEAIYKFHHDFMLPQVKDFCITHTLIFSNKNAAFSTHLFTNIQMNFSTLVGTAN